MASGIIWGISGSISFPQIVKLNLATLAIQTQFTAPHPPSGIYSPNPNFGNGKGLTVDFTNSLIYYGYSGSQGLANDPDIYLSDLNGTNLGVWVNMFAIFAGFGGIATLYLDGTSIWVSDATPPPFNNPFAWQMDIATKTLIKRVTLGSAGGPPFAPGLSYVNTQVTPNIVILQKSNGGSLFDLYHLSGTTLTLVTSSFINGAAAGFGSTFYQGIAFDGTHYIISNYTSATGPNNTQNLLYFDSTSGAFVSSVTTLAPGPQASYGWNLQGISFGAAPAPVVPSNFRIQLRGVKRSPKV